MCYLPSQCGRASGCPAGGRAAEGGRCDVAFAAGLLRPGWAGCDAALAAGLAQPAIVWARGVLACESMWKSMSVAAGVWWRDVLGEMMRSLGGYCSGGASREASSCGGKGLCLFASVRSVIEYTPLKVRRESHNAINKDFK